MGYTYNRNISDERLSKSPILKPEIDKAYKSLYIGKEIKIIDRRGDPVFSNIKTIKDEVDFFNKWMIQFKSGNSYTMAEYCIHLRSESQPLGYSTPIDGRIRER